MKDVACSRESRYACRVGEEICMKGNVWKINIQMGG
jgi:hypothetical protein